MKSLLSVLVVGLVSVGAASADQGRGNSEGRGKGPDKVATRGADKAERAYDGVEKLIEMKVSYDTDRRRALEDCGIWSALALPGEAKMGVEDPREMERLAVQAEPYAHRRWLVASDPDEHVEQIATYVGYGFDHLVFHFPGDDQEAAVERYGRDILPRLRARFG